MRGLETRIWNQIRHVPTRNGAASFRNVAMIDSATIFPVLGFSEGTFSIESVNDAESAYQDSFDADGCLKEGPLNDIVAKLAHAFHDWVEMILRARELLLHDAAREKETA